ncbi:penicillin acylase family protein [bacterium]|nr:penicillin acylase family protein [bacterium]
MPRALKIILIIFTIGLIGLLSLCGIGFHLLHRTIPQTEGSLTLEGLKDSVQVYRDHYSIPHIIAANEADAYFAQGFVTAQDRMWQMDLWRRAANGRVSQIFGRNGMRQDSLALTIGFRRIAIQLEKQISPAQRARYQAYSNGINAYRNAYKGRWSLEFIMFGYYPAPWTVLDCLTMSKWTAWNLASGWNHEVITGELLRQLGHVQFKALFPGTDWSKTDIHAIKIADLPTIQPELLIPSIPPGNSSAWVVSGAKTQTGLPLLAGDMQTEHMLPSNWYEIHLISDAMDVSGLTIPGIPGVLMGHTPALGWTISHIPSRDINLVLVNKNEHIDIIRESIILPRDSSISLTIETTQYGPIVSDLLGSKGPDYALSWTGMKSGESGEAIYSINTSKNLNDLQKALDNWNLSAFAFIFADTLGNTGLRTAGRLNPNKLLPRRSQAQYSIKPQHISIMNPPSGLVYNAKNSYFKNYSCITPLDSRSQRINAMLTNNDSLSIRDMQALQNDMLSPWAATLAHQIFTMIDINRIADDDLSKLLENWETWPGSMQAGSKEAAIFQVFLYQYARKTLLPLIGETLLKHFWSMPEAVRQAIEEMITQQYSPLIAGQGRDKEVLIHSAMDSTAAWLHKNLGAASNWSLGNLQTLTLTHPLGDHPLLAPTFNLGPIAMGGSPTTVSAVQADLKHIRSGVSTRLIVDLSNRNQHLAIIPNGQSGHIIDAHYKDQMPLFLNKQYHPCISSIRQIKRSGWKKLSIYPESTND